MEMIEKWKVKRVADGRSDTVVPLRSEPESEAYLTRTVTSSLTALPGNTVSGQVALSCSSWRCVIVIIDKQMPV